jgi:glucose-6-phosphate isomerase
MPIKSQYRPNSDADKHHKVLISNFIAQTRALMMGKTEDEVRRELFPTEEDYGELEHLVKHKSFQGNRPSNSIIFEELNPKTLGSLLAIYEHKIFVQGVIWNINSFDQWGVEYGKQIANLVLPELNVNRDTTAFDSSTNNLINNFKKNR